MDDRIEDATSLYERAVFSGDADALTAADRALDAVEADLALARGRIMHTRFLLQRDTEPGQATGDPAELELFERAARLYKALGDVGGEAESLFWVGCFHQVVGGDNESAAPVLRKSLELAAQTGAKPTMSEALRHLGIAAHTAGDLVAAREYLEESTRLRRETGNWPGVAANLVGLGYIAAAQGRPDDALGILDEAAELARASDAQRILRSVDEARASI